MGRFTRSGKIVVCSVLVFLIFTLISGVSHAVTFTVTNPGDAGAGTLRDAIDMANANSNGPGVVDVIEFGIPLPNSIDLITGELEITDDLTITGPGAGMLTVSGGNSSRIFVMSGGTEIKISKLRIADGNQTGAGFDGFASAIFIQSPNSNIELSDCIVEDNTAKSLGAVLLGVHSTQLVVNRCSFTNNSSIATGGNSALGGVFGLAAADLTLEVNDSSFTSNFSQTESGLAFGGVINLGATPLDVEFNNCTFDSNYSVSTNGGLSFGGVLADGATDNNVEFTNCTFYNNYAQCDGNDCEVYGGAIGSGGASDISCNHCTFLSNSVSCTGSNCTAEGETIAPPITGSMTIANSIIQADNTANNCIDSGAITSLGYNIDNGSSCVDGSVMGDKINTDPGLDPLGLQDNGGPTETIALIPGSMAIDMADPASIVTEDQRGAPRPFNLINDIGAFEFGATPPADLLLGNIFPGIKNNINFITASNATPEGRVAFVWGFRLGSLTISGLGCTDIELGISPIQLIGRATADGDGEATLKFFVPALGNTVIAYTQAVDLDTCLVSEVIENILLNN
jgi:hypothetical protein